MYLIELIDKYYNIYKQEYEENKPLKDDLEKRYNKLKQDYKDGKLTYIDYDGKVHNYISFERENYYCSRSVEMDNPILFREYKELIAKLDTLRNNMISLTNIKNNNERICIIDKKNYSSFPTHDKIINFVGSNANSDYSSSSKGEINGELDGSSFLGCGSASGTLNGDYDHNVNGKYEESIIIKYKYNLDYEIDEFLFDINDYL